MNQKQIRAAVEAMLFASGDPIGADKLAQAVQLPQLSVEAALEALRERYAREDSGLCLLHLNTRWQLATKTEFAECVRRVLDTRRSGNTCTVYLYVAFGSYDLTEEGYVLQTGVEDAGAHLAPVRRHARLAQPVGQRRVGATGGHQQVVAHQGTQTGQTRFQKFRKAPLIVMPQRVGQRAGRAELNIRHRRGRGTGQPGRVRLGHAQQPGQRGPIALHVHRVQDAGGRRPQQSPIPHIFRLRTSCPIF